MPDRSMSETQLPPLKPYHPTTFLERGVALPFTTPRLIGTRARPSSEQSVELVIFNPSGGRGVYIVPCAGITAFCQPTLHDSIFNERISKMANVTPAIIRTVARQVAAEGFAGEDARETAIQAAAADKNDRIVTNYQLLMALTQQVARSSNALADDDARQTLNRGDYARLMVSRVAPRVGRSPNWTAAALEGLGGVLSNIGAGAIEATGRVPRLYNLLRQVSTDIASWSRCQTDDDLTACTEMVIRVAAVTLSITETTIANARGLTNDMVNLLRTWAADPNFVIRLASRPEWLLDGWEQICLLWNDATDDRQRRAAVAEIVDLVPILPKEVSEWSHNPSLLDDVRRYRRVVAFHEDWRTGEFVLDTIARNERLRATACL